MNTLRRKARTSDALPGIIAFSIPLCWVLGGLLIGASGIMLVMKILMEAGIITTLFFSWGALLIPFGIGAVLMLLAIALLIFVAWIG